MEAKYFGRYVFNVKGFELSWVGLLIASVI